MHRSSRVFLLILVISGLLVAGCSSPLKSPEIQVEGAHLSSVSLTTLTLDVLLSVDNPNPVGITLKSLSFDVYYGDGNEWKYLSHGEQTNITIDPGKNNVTVPVTVKTSDALGAMLSFTNNREIPLQIRGVVVPDLPGGLSPEIPFTKTISVTR
jgi:LEA14-like dessication related protein